MQLSDAPTGAFWRQTGEDRQTELAMNTRETAAVVDIYNTDLERHLFAPAPHRNRSSNGNFNRLTDWLRDWLVTGWTRWKHLAEAIYLT